MERDKFLTEAMGGKINFACFVDGDAISDCVMDKDSGYTFRDCVNATEYGKREECHEWKQNLIYGVNDFSTWQGFGKLWEWAQKQEWYWFMISEYSDSDNGIDIKKLINPDRFANAVYEFLKERT